MKAKKISIIAILYFFYSILVLFYFILSGNEYSWVSEIDETIVIPEDDDILIKKHILSFPVLLTSFIILYYSYNNLNIIYKIISCVLMLSSIALFFI